LNVELAAGPLLKQWGWAAGKALDAAFGPKGPVTVSFFDVGNTNTALRAAFVGQKQRGNCRRSTQAVVAGPLAPRSICGAASTSCNGIHPRLGGCETVQAANWL